MILIIACNKFMVPEELNLENGEPGAGKKRRAGLPGDNRT
jgi:hypothetical protein